MRSIFTLALNTLKVTLRKKSNLIGYFIMPIVSLAIIMAIMGKGEVTKIKIGVVNKDNSVISTDMLKYLENTGKFENIPIEEKDVQNNVVNKNVNLAIIIPKGFSEEVYNNKLESIKMVSIQGKEVTAWVENYTNLYIKNILDIAKASKGNKDKFNSIYNGYKNQDLKLSVEKVKDKALNKELTERGLGILIMFLLIGATSTSNIILKEKRERTYQRICSTPVNSRIYMISNVLANIIIISIQVILAIVAIKCILNIEIYMEVYKLFLVMMLLGIVSIGIGMIVVAFSESTAEAGNLSTLIITPTCMLGGCFWPMKIMPDKIQKISNFVPQKWTIEAISKLQNGEGIKEIGINIVILLAFALVLFLVANFKMKKSDKVGSFI
ncbi:ABC transporter permease [Clostridium sp. MB40-C1]|uniref:ABC transporter permease n=1 Tax=Clostridium sp. MB40-C1 TaxID=3070996 RepID=UPI0027E18E46|nr:ABC transporter permease [Clostridium sp. MB40-C1]WMJ79461.1 ABC transporter permease [Clostridium sp. MB40-C1]